MSGVKPKVLVLGGLGFIGRNLVHYLVSKNLASVVRVFDKVTPERANLYTPHKELFATADYTSTTAPLQLRTGNLISPEAIKEAFQIEGEFDYVVNLACETRYSQEDDVYQQKIVNLAVNLAKEAVNRGVKKFVEISTAQCYHPPDKNDKPCKESAKIAPWTSLAKFKVKAEEALKTVPGLPLVILRPAIVYGPGDTSGISPRLVSGAIYKYLNKKMKILWTSELRVHTVHVNDVCKAIVHSFNLPAGSVYNLVDKNDTTQGKINALIEKLFDIKTGFISVVKCKLAQVNLSAAAEEVNRRHMKPWSEMLSKKAIGSTPLTPYVEPELLMKTPMMIDGTSIEATGFTYDVPQMTLESLREQLNYFIQQKLFPV